MRRGMYLSLLLAVAFPVASLASTTLPKAGEPESVPLTFGEGGVVFTTLGTENPDEVISVLVDTGAEMSSLDHQLPVIKRGRAGNPVTDGTRVFGQKFMIPRLCVGQLGFPNEWVVSTQFNHMHQMGKHQGILGGSTMQKLVLELDYAGNVLKLHNPSGWKPNEEDREVKSRFEGVLPTVELRFGAEGDTSAWALVDTGASGVGLLAYPAAHDQLKGKVVGGQQTGMRVQGGFTYQNGTPELCHLGPFKLQVPTVRASAGPTGKANWTAILGGMALRHFVVTVHYPRKKVYLRPGPALKAFMEKQAAQADGAGTEPAEGGVEAMAAGDPEPTNQPRWDPNDPRVKAWVKAMKERQKQQQKKAAKEAQEAKAAQEEQPAAR
jgi:predicted aspartyl protease